jgi:hypothetical protein
MYLGENVGCDQRGEISRILQNVIVTTCNVALQRDLTPVLLEQPQNIHGYFHDRADILYVTLWRGCGATFGFLLLPFILI